MVRLKQLYSHDMLHTRFSTILNWLLLHARASRHWHDRPTMQPPGLRRGAWTLGPELLALISHIGSDIRNRSMIMMAKHDKT